MKEVCSPINTRSTSPALNSGPKLPLSPGARSDPGRSRADQTSFPATPIRAPISHGDQGGELLVHGPAGPQPMPDSAPQGEPRERETAVDRDPHLEQE
jgi:hypothetical protein